LKDGIPHPAETKRQSQYVIHKEHYRFYYYMLNLLDGGRQQIFFLVWIVRAGGKTITT
jgi:hypothetical protein